MTQTIRRKSAKSSTTARSVRFTLAQIGAETAVVRQRAQAALRNAEHNVDELRHQAAQAALHWVVAHDDRVRQLRSWLKGTRGEKVFNTVLAQIRREARPATTAARRVTKGRRIRKT